MSLPNFQSMFEKESTDKKKYTTQKALGERSGNAMITNIQARTICEYISTGMTYDEIISVMRVPEEDKKRFKALLSRIKNRKSWIHISSAYVW